jgi:hypothetical protein
MAFLGQLKLNGDPFARDGIAPMGPVRAAFEQLMRHVELGTTIILIVGPGGSGKTFLLGIAEEACRTCGISVLRIERGDLAHTVIGKHVDLLLVDEADFVDQATLNFIAGHPETAKTVVFACRTPCSVGDMAAPTLVNLLRSRRVKRAISWWNAQPLPAAPTFSPPTRWTRWLPERWACQGCCDRLARSRFSLQPMKARVASAWSMWPTLSIRKVGRADYPTKKGVQNRAPPTFPFRPSPAWPQSRKLRASLRR